MISVKAAKQFASEHFPEAPEELVKFLEIDVRVAALDGCDGWCLTAGHKSIIRINKNLSPIRQRFTLAHELGHLILGIPGIVGESYEDMIRSDSNEERKVNELASELLMPAEIVQGIVQSLPVVALQLKRLAKKANVSELAAAIRVCNLAEDLGLVNASVVLFESADVVKWQWSTTLSMTNGEAKELVRGARKSAPQAFRYEQGEEVVVASILENPIFHSTTMFVQLLPSEVGHQLSPAEKRAILEKSLYKNNKTLQGQMSGYLGYLKTQIAGKTQKQVEHEFWRRYSERLKETALDTRDGREYVRLRIAEWY